MRNHLNREKREEREEIPDEMRAVQVREVMEPYRYAKEATNETEELLGFGEAR